MGGMSEITGQDRLAVITALEYMAFESDRVDRLALPFKDRSSAPLYALARRLRAEAQEDHDREDGRDV
jgi:hypothetical protein